MGANKKALQSILELTKSLKEDYVKLKAEGKTQSEAAEAKFKEMFEKREQVIRDDVMMRFRKGEHLAPHEGDPEESFHGNPFIVNKSDDPKRREQMSFNDDVYIISKMLRCHPTQTKTWRKNQAAVSEIRKAMNTATANQGGDWVPTEFSADLIDQYRLSLMVANLFRSLQMPTNPYKLPINTGNVTVYKVAENTADATEASRITASTPSGAANVTMTASKIAARSVFSEEVNEDSIIPVLPMLKENLARNMADAWESIWINGDTTLPGNLDIDVTASTDFKTTAKGLRKRAKESTSALYALTTFNLVNLRTLRTGMGKYGVNPSELVFITGPKGYNKMLGIDEVTTLEKYGSGATILTGELGRLDGIPIVVSPHIREDLSTTGYYDVTTTDNTIIILANRRSHLAGEKRKMTLKTFEDIQTDETVMVTTMRGTIEDIYTAVADNPVVVGRDLSTS
jgi:HK97 family phage major capsid protein